MAGEIAQAAQPLTAPRQGSTVNDLISLAGGLASKREEMRRTRQQEAIQQALAEVEQRKVAAVEQGVQQHAQELEQAQRQHEDQLVIDAQNADSQRTIAEAQRTSAAAQMAAQKRTQEQLDAEESSSSEILSHLYHYTPDKIKALKGGSAGELNHLRALELEDSKGRAYSAGEVLKARAEIWSIANTRMGQAQAEWKDRRDQAAEFVKGIISQPVLPLPNGKVLHLSPEQKTALTATITMPAAERMQVVKQFADQGLDLGALAEFDASDARLQQERANYDKAQADYYSNVAPAIQGAQGRVSVSEMGSGTGAGAKPPEPGDTDPRAARRTAMDKLELAARTHQVDFYNHWSTIDSAQPPGPDGRPGPSPVDEVLQSMGYSRDTYYKSVILPMEQARQQAAATAQQGGGQPQAMPPLATSFEKYVGLPENKEKAKPFGDTPLEQQQRNSHWQVLKDAARGKKGEQLPASRALDAAYNLIRMGVSPKEVLDSLSKNQFLHDFVSDRINSQRVTVGR